MHQGICGDCPAFVAIETNTNIYYIYITYNNL